VWLDATIINFSNSKLPEALKLHIAYPKITTSSANAQLHVVFINLVKTESKEFLDTFFQQRLSLPWFSTPMSSSRTEHNYQLARIISTRTGHKFPARKKDRPQFGASLDCFTASTVNKRIRGEQTSQ
jgi:hypothetical protein